MTLESTAIAPMKQNDAVEQKASTANQPYINLIDEWKAARSKDTTHINPNTPLQIDFAEHDSKNSIYKDQMNLDLNNLQTDIKNAQNGQLDTAKLNKDMAAVKGDANWWEKHDAGLSETKPITDDLKKEMSVLEKGAAGLQKGDSKEASAMMFSGFKDVKDDLVTLENADYLKRNPPKHEPTPEPPPPPKPPTPTPPGGETFTDVQNKAGWVANLKAPEIGGTGINPAVSLTQNPDGSLDYKSSGGKYTDTLISKDFGAIGSQNGKTNFGLSLDVTPKNIGDAQALEFDMANTENKKMAMFGSQFQLQGNDSSGKPIPKGMMAFDTWNTQKSEWVTAAIIPAFKEGQQYHLQYNYSQTGDTYTYDSVSINGQKIALDSNATTFNKAPTNWQDVLKMQLQLDNAGKPGAVEATYNNIQVTSS